jgi:2-(1,2-epoxy-1,2-dihydrophenyl)acetyl-CoA isomerase
VSGVVEYEVTDGVAEIRLNRPARLNAVTPELVEELCHALEQAIRADVSAALLCGNGRSFCSGYDLRQPPREQTGAERRQELERIQDVTRLIRRSPHPVIAAVQGYALGAGCEFALACDLVVVARDAVLGFPEVEVGLSITGGVTKLLPQVMGSARAKHFVLLGERIPAEVAMRHGLASSLVDSEELMAAARAQARRLASLPQASLRTAKRALDRAPMVGLEEALELEIADAISLTGIDQGWTGADAFRRKHDKAPETDEGISHA